jgi:NTE family protein
MSAEKRTADGGKPCYALVLQGGGALGAYHIGAYQALAENDLLPDWVCGISVGAINAAVIVGNAPAERLARLDALWEFISWPALFDPFGGKALALLYNTASNAEALMFGQPNFFQPRPINPFFAAPGPQALSFYDTSPLRFTLRRFADFDRINARETRLSLGATDVVTGNLEFFDNASAALGPEHVMASGSLPPGFPPTLVGDRLYWDGGCVSNTPLEAVLQDQPPGHTVVFMIDLWSASGPPPRTMNDVLWREKQIQYASRTAAHIDAVATKVNLRHAVGLLKQAGAAELSRAVPDGGALTAESRLDIVHIVYHPTADQIPNSDAEFSRASIRERRLAGHADMKRAIEAEPWFRQQKPPHLGAMVYRVKDQKVTTLAPLDLHRISDQAAPPPSVPPSDAPPTPTRRKRA